MLKITVKISEKDILDFLIRNYYASEREKNKKNKIRFILGLFLFFTAFYFLLTDDHTKAVIFFILAMCWFFIVPYYLRSSVKSTYKKHVRENMGMIINKPISFELREKGLFVKYDLEEALFLYESIHSVLRAGRNIYINHKGKTPLIIPYSGNTNDIDKFVASLEERLETQGDRP